MRFLLDPTMQMRRLRRPPVAGVRCVILRTEVTALLVMRSLLHPPYEQCLAMSLPNLTSFFSGPAGPSLRVTPY